MNLIIVLVLIPVMIGLYLITLGLWELRLGFDRPKYAKLMFSGLVLVLVAPFFLSGLFMGASTYFR